MDIMTVLKTAQKATKFGVTKYASEILLGAGIGLGLCGTVEACKSTLKLEETLTPQKNKIEYIKGCRDGVIETPEKYKNYTIADFKKDLTKAYLETGYKVCRLYSKPIILGTVSIGSLLGSHKILNKRNAMLLTAYVTLDETFTGYRSRVVDEYGEAVDTHLYYNTEIDEVEVTEVDGKGKEKKVKKKVQYVDEKVAKKNPYSFLFDCGSVCWKNDAVGNLTFLKAQENYATQKLIAHKRLFLSEVLDALGFDIQDEETLEFAHNYGWTYGEGDNFVDFGLRKYEDLDMPVYSQDNAYWLDFNCDGYMFKRLSHPEDEITCKVDMRDMFDGQPVDC